jgi:hypothetical protein
MNYLAPAYLTPYVMTGSVAILTSTLYGLRRARAAWGVSALLILWFFTALVTTWLGHYRGSATGLPTIQYGLLLPILIGVALSRWWPALRRVVDATPQSFLVGVQLYRALGAVFVILYAAGRLPGAFALPAGIGDVVVGVLAPAVAIAYTRGGRGSAGLLRAWNLFGITDLVVAVATGFLTSPSQFQRLAFDHPNQLIDAFPLAMIPVFLVPLSVLLHLASLAKLKRQSV